MKTFMEKPSPLLITSSFLMGAIVTILFLAQMSWQPMHNCQQPASSAMTEGCTIMEYGYPERFIKPAVNVGEQNVVFVTVDIDKTALLTNWLIWSGASFVALYVLTFEAVWPSELKAKKASRRKARGK